MLFSKVLEEEHFPGKLGTGTRFENAKKEFTKKGVKNPEALAAAIGRKKYGKKRFQKLSKEGKKWSQRYFQFFILYIFH